MRDLDNFLLLIKSKIKTQKRIQLQHFKTFNLPLVNQLVKSKTNIKKRLRKKSFKLVTITIGKSTQNMEINSAKGIQLP